MPGRQAGDDIGVFLAVCTAGSFAAAAAGLALTSSAVAKAVDRLERRLGVRLFHRTTRRLAPTAEGEIYRAACQAARHRLDSVEAELAALAAEPAGLVRLSLPPLLGAEIVAPALYPLCEAWPLLRFDLSIATARVDLPGEGIDLAVRIGDLPDLPGLAARRLATQRVVLCGSRSYFAARPLPLTVEDLAAHDLVASARQGQPASWHFRGAEGDLQVFAPPARLLLDGSLLALSAIRAGRGVGLVPRWLAHEDLARGDLLPVLDDRIAGHMPIHALWVQSPTMLPRLRVTIDAITAAMRGAAARGVLA